MWPRISSVRYSAASIATVIRLRSRLLRSGCSHTSPNSTSSRSCPSLGMNSYTVGFFGAMGRSPRAWVVLAKADLRGARWPGQRVVCWLRAVKEGLKWTSTSRRARRVATRHALGVGTPVEADVDRARERLGITAFLRAPVVEDGVLSLPRLRVDVGGVPAVRILGRRPERALLALAADPDGQTLLDGLRIAARVVEVEVLALEVRDGLIEEHAQDLHRFLEMILADADPLEGDAETLVLVLMPARADAQLAAAAREVVDGADGLGEHARVPVVDADHERTDLHMLGVERDGRHGADGLEAGSVPVAVGRLLEVVGGGEPVEAVGVGIAPQLAHLGHRPAHVPQVHPEGHRHRKISRGSYRVVNVNPPSTTRVCPVTQRASSLAR